MDDVATALAAENRRLRAEAKRLEARVRALETSRWHRLNPRRALSWAHRPAAVSAGESRVDAAPPAVVAQGTSRAPSPRLAEFQRVMDKGRFTHFWALGDADRWEPILAALGGRSSSILEVGSFEGLWTCLALWRLPDARVTCIDTFEGGLDHVGTDTVPDQLEEIFDGNVAVVDSARVRKLVGLSRARLADLLEEEERFDLVYVDGSHLGLDVLVDAAYSWQLLRPGGYLVFDDYVWAELGTDPLLRPGPAIDAFLTVVAGKYEVVFTEAKLAVRKTA